MRISNIDTLSALFDRLICERIKWYFFVKEGTWDKADHQVEVVDNIKHRISDLFAEAFQDGQYNYLAEKRTFNENSIVEELEDLINNDINIGEADRARLAEATSDDPDHNILINNEKRLRKANEGRSVNKNAIDEKLKKALEE